MKVAQPALDGAMPLDRNADVEILRHDEGGGRVGLEEIGDLGAHDQHAWFFEHWTCPRDRRQQSGSELHAPSIGSVGFRIYLLVGSRVSPRDTVSATALSAAAPSPISTTFLRAARPWPRARMRQGLSASSLTARNHAISLVVQQTVSRIYDAMSCCTSAGRSCNVPIVYVGRASDGASLRLRHAESDSHAVRMPKASAPVMSVFN